MGHWQTPPMLTPFCGDVLTGLAPSRQVHVGGLPGDAGVGVSVVEPGRQVHPGLRLGCAVVEPSAQPHVPEGRQLSKNTPEQHSALLQQNSVGPLQQRAPHVSSMGHGPDATCVNNSRRVKPAMDRLPPSPLLLRVRTGVPQASQASISLESTGHPVVSVTSAGTHRPPTPSSAL